MPAARTDSDGARPFPPAVYAAALRDTIVDAALTGPMLHVLAFGGAYLTNFAKDLGATGTQLGWLTTAGALAMLAQFAASYVIERTGHRRRVALVSYLLARAAWIPILILCMLPGLPTATRVWLLIAGVGIHQACQTAGGCGWLSWVRDLVPLAERGAYLARRNQALQWASVIAVFATAYLIDERQKTLGLQAYPGPLLTCALLATSGLLWLRRVPEPPRPPSGWGEKSPRYRQLLVEALKDRDLRCMVAFQTLWTTAARLAAPFVQVYLRRTLGLSFVQITLFQQLARASNALQQRFWGPLIDRYGNRPVLVLSATILAVSGLLWLVVDRSNYWVCLPILYLAQGAGNAGIGTSSTNQVLRLAPGGSPSVYLATFNAIAGLLSAIAPPLAGRLDDALGGQRVRMGPFALLGVQILFVIQFVLRMGAVGMAAIVREPRAARFGRFVRGLARSSRRNPIAVSFRALLLYRRWRTVRRRRARQRMP